MIEKKPNNNMENRNSTNLGDNSSELSELKKKLSQGEKPKENLENNPKNNPKNNPRNPEKKQEEKPEISDTKEEKNPQKNSVEAQENIEFMFQRVEAFLANISDLKNLKNAKKDWALTVKAVVKDLSNKQSQEKAKEIYLKRLENLYEKRAEEIKNQEKLPKKSPKKSPEKKQEKKPQKNKENFSEKIEKDFEEIFKRVDKYFSESKTLEELEEKKIDWGRIIFQTSKDFKISPAFYLSKMKQKYQKRLEEIKKIEEVLDDWNFEEDLNKDEEKVKDGQFSSLKSKKVIYGNAAKMQEKAFYRDMDKNFIKDEEWKKDPENSSEKNTETNTETNTESNTENTENKPKNPENNSTEKPKNSENSETFTGFEKEEILKYYIQNKENLDKVKFMGMINMSDFAGRINSPEDFGKYLTEQENIEKALKERDDEINIEKDLSPAEAYLASKENPDEWMDTWKIEEILAKKNKKNFLERLFDKNKDENQDSKNPLNVSAERLEESDSKILRGTGKFGTWSKNFMLSSPYIGGGLFLGYLGLKFLLAPYIWYKHILKTGWGKDGKK